MKNIYLTIVIFFSTSHAFCSSTNNPAPTPGISNRQQASGIQQARYIAQRMDVLAAANQELAQLELMLQNAESNLKSSSQAVDRISRTYLISQVVAGVGIGITLVYENKTGNPYPGRVVRTAVIINWLVQFGLFIGYGTKQQLDQNKIEKIKAAIAVKRQQLENEIQLYQNLKN